MDPSTLGKKYDKIAQWWHNRHKESAYGVEQVKRALTFASGGSLALDVGCGAGGRMIRLLEEGGFLITGLDVSEKMIKLATENHPEHTFIQQDICDWQTEQKFDFIVAWDSLFHLPLAMQEAVVSKLCSVLKQGGVLIYSFGDACGEHTDQWQGDTFYYSSVGINRNLEVLLNNGLSILHLELDQHPEKHVYTVALKPHSE